MSATRQWYPHYVRDFKAKTSHLSLAERGAYRALMDEYWERQGPLPADERALCRLVGAFPDEWAEVRDNVLAFFEERDGLLHHKRIDAEIAEARTKHETKVAAIAKARSHIKPDNKPDNSADNSIDDNRHLNGKTVPHTTNTNHLKNIKPPSETVAARAGVFNGKNGGGEHFDVERFLTDQDRANAKKNAPGWDIYHLIQVYNGSVGLRGKPKYPGKAFAAWCGKYTKGQPP